ncbi:MAG: ROK family protein [Planctomycetota bacterium]|nr:ROK family protein [Planctomycetota bacterium]
MSVPYFVGLDLGGTEVKVGLCSARGEVVWSDRRPSQAHQGQQAILEALAAAVDTALLEAATHQGEVVAIGLGTPGVVDPASGVIRFPVANLGGWHGTDIVGFFRQRFEVPAVVENDANCAAWGEYCTGAGIGARTLLLATVGTGIGGGAVIDGELLRGPSGGAMELGHIILERSGRRCNCGLVGCVEAYAGGWGMAQEWGRRRALPGESPGVSQLVEMGIAGDPLANEILDEGATALGAGMMSALHLLNPDVVVVGGGIIDARPRHLELIESELRSRVLPKASTDLKVVRAQHGNRAGWIGAAMCAEKSVRGGSGA